MGFLNKIFTNSKENILLSVIVELKEVIKELRNDKILLNQDNKELRERLFNNDSNKKGSLNKKLTRKEKVLLNFWENNPNITKKQLAKLTKYQLNSLKVMCSKVRKKGFIIDFREDK